MKTFRLIKNTALLLTALMAFQAVSLGQTSYLPKNLGEKVNSKYAEINPIMHPDGKTLYFSRANHPDNIWGKANSQDIWMSTLNDDGTWSEAVHLPRAINLGRYNAIFGILNNGTTFIINGRYTPNGKHWIDRGLSTIEKLDSNAWGTPHPIIIPRYPRKNRGRTTSGYVTPDGKFILLSFSNWEGGKRNKLYISIRKSNGKYGKLKRLKIGNGKACDSYEAPFLSSDGNALFFSCKKNGKYNLYYSQRSDESYLNWAEPIALSDTVNSSGWESYYHLNFKGNWAYFCSDSNSAGKSDVFRIKIFEDNPYIKLHGLVLNKLDQQLMLKDSLYTILVNGKPADSIRIDRAAASYEMILPFGEKYVIKPELTSWVGVPDTLDATTINEYTELERNIYFEPIPYVKIFGKIINTRNNIPISPELKYRILVNGQPNDSVHYSNEIAGYSALLPLGKKYTVSLDLPNFISKPDTVDATNLTSYLEKQIDFHVKSVPWVEVKGVALDNVTFTPIIGASKPKLMVNGKLADSIAIDPVSGQFTIRLPFGAKYKMAIKSKYYNPLVNELDLTGYVEYAKVKHEVYAERKDANMATLRGKIINLKTGKPLDRTIPVKLKVNGVESRGFRYDSTTASYTLKLPVGVSYDILPAVKNFYNKYERVNLTKARKGARIAKNFYVTPIEIGQSVNIDFIYFATGKANLKPASFRSLNALVDFLKEYPNVIVEIGGHTDNVGSLAVNQRISERRAKAVADYVISMGIPESRIKWKGYNYSKPKASNRTARGRAKNRRVEFTIIGI